MKKFDLLGSTDNFFYHPASTDIMPDVCFFILNNQRWKVEFSVYEGWTKTVSYQDKKQSDTLYVVSKGKERIVRIIQGEKVITYRNLDYGEVNNLS